jgi:hypothetical protein
MGCSTTIKQSKKRKKRRLARISLPMVDDIAKGQRLATVEILNEGKTPEKVDELATGALVYSQVLTLALLDKLPPDKPLACREGCHWCCSLEVAVTPPELFHIARLLRERLYEAEIAALVTSIDGVLAERQDGKRPYCALLKDGRCSVYKDRPLMCQGWNSHDAGACEQYAVTGRGGTPVYLPQRDAAVSVVQGVLQGLSRVGLSGKNLELMSALKRALESPDLEERYLAGEKVFSGDKA